MKGAVVKNKYKAVIINNIWSVLAFVIIGLVCSPVFAVDGGQEIIYSIPFFGAALYLAFGFFCLKDTDESIFLSVTGLVVIIAASLVLEAVQLTGLYVVYLVIAFNWVFSGALEEVFGRIGGEALSTLGYFFGAFTPPIILLLGFTLRKRFRSRHGLTKSGASATVVDSMPDSEARSL